MEPVSFVYSLPYIGFLAAYLLLTLCENRIGRSYSRAVCCLLFLFFIGGRGYVGWDCHGYAKIYEAFPSVFDSSFINAIINRGSEKDAAMEKGFLVYMAVVKSLGFNYLMFSFLSALIDILLVDRFIQRFCPNYALAMFLFVYVYCNSEINILRNMKAISLFLFSLQYAEQRRIVPYMLLNVLGVSFHFSAVFFILSYWLFRVPVGRKAFAAVVVLLNVAYFANVYSRTDMIGGLIVQASQWLGGKAEIVAGVYTNMALSKAGITVGCVERLITASLIFAFWPALKEKEARGRIFINSFIAYLALTNLFWAFGAIKERMALLFMFCYIFIWSAVVKAVALKRMRYLTLGFMMVYAAFRFSALYGTVFYRYDNFLLPGYEDEDQRRGTFDRYKNILEQ